MSIYQFDHALNEKYCREAREISIKVDEIRKNNPSDKRIPGLVNQAKALQDKALTMVKEQLERRNGKR